MLMGLIAALVVGATQTAPAKPSEQDRLVEGCHGVLLNARQRLRQADPRQPRIASALAAVDARLAARLDDGEIGEGELAVILQTSVNASALSYAEQLDGCMDAFAEPDGTRN